MKSEKFLILFCFFIVYIVWGSTYLANIIAIESIPPFFLVWSRIGIAGAILLLITILIGKWEMPTKKQWRNLAISSILFLGIGLTGAVWAEQFIDSGVTALVISIEPLVVVLLMWAINKSLPKWTKFIGCFIGMVGMYILVSQQEVVAGPDDIKGISAILFSILCWGLGSVFISKADLPKSMFTVAALQMLISAVLIFIVSYFNGDFNDLVLTDLAPKIYYSWSYLIIFGSIIAYSAFNYLLKKVSPEKVATATYVHPIVAVFLGWFIRNEVITFQTLVAMGVMLTGVYFINTNFDLMLSIKNRKARRATKPF
ncbi:EamA family transporter [Portibacter lacus]|uniref:Membrane protein n=1 Tax=Portibacter lacus TaxID=1099794 RepID=A0AA37WH95_9BACT|nr:EamA family transporter [Portibacter lacus]GLR19139.1 membrane protein [Portibacter lacus]